MIPTSRLPDVLRRIGEMSTACGLQVANIFHAGDGNLHPLDGHDANDPVSFHKAETFGADILKLCESSAGGCLTGEHGVGVEKRDLMGAAVQRDRARPAAPHQIRLRPGKDWLLNPAKVFPPAPTPGAVPRRMSDAP